MNLKYLIIQLKILANFLILINIKNSGPTIIYFYINIDSFYQRNIILITNYFIYQQ